MIKPLRGQSRRLRRGVYLLPSLFTFGNIILGFYAVIRGLRGDFQTAAVLVYIAGFVDTLDGRIARMTRTESDFGREFDSLADVLTFGAAPALLAHLWGLRHFGRLGWLIPLFYLLCAATRLARFNVQTRSVDSRFFVGLPVPAAAATLVSLVYFIPPQHLALWPDVLMMAGLILTGILMVSTFRYISSKQLDLTQRWSYRNAVLLGVLLLLIAYNPPALFFSAAIIYTLSGPLSWLFRRLVRRPAPTKDLPDERKADG